MIRPPPKSPLFPSPTLFRSELARLGQRRPRHAGELLVHAEVVLEGDGRQRLVLRHDRSEEHTSELQSRLHLVCRLLLEKKKGEESFDMRRLIVGGWEWSVRG